MTEEREYLISRYGPEMAITPSEINRLVATLEEIAKKARQRVLVEYVLPQNTGAKV